VITTPHPPASHDHKPFVNPCHEALRPDGMFAGDGSAVVALTARARDRRGQHHSTHRLRSGLVHRQRWPWIANLKIEEQACKFEHILSAGATDRFARFWAIPALVRMGRRFRQGVLPG